MKSSKFPVVCPNCGCVFEIEVEVLKDGIGVKFLSEIKKAKPVDLDAIRSEKL